MPYASTTASVRDDAPSPSASLAVVLGVAASVTSLLVVVAGFALASATLLGITTVPIGWGAGLCVGGWALAAAVRERQQGYRTSRGVETGEPT